MGNQKQTKRQVVEETKKEEKVVVDNTENDTAEDFENFDCNGTSCDDCSYKEKCDEMLEEAEEPKKKKWFSKENLKKAGKAVLYGAALVTVYSLGKAVERSKYNHDDFDDDYCIPELSTDDVEPMQIEEKHHYEFPVQNKPVTEETSEPEQISEHIESEE